MKIKDLFIYKSSPVSGEFALSSPEENKSVNNSVNDYIKAPISNTSSVPYLKGKVSHKISENLQFIKDAFCTDKNFDLMVREFKVKCKNGDKQGFLIFYDGLVNKDYVNRDLLRSLITRFTLFVKEKSLL